MVYKYLTALFLSVFLGIVLIISSCSQAPLNNSEATQLMYDLTSGNENKVQNAIDRILAAKDSRYVSVFMELIRAGHLGILHVPDAMSALETLSGEEFYLWPEWV